MVEVNELTKTYGSGKSSVKALRSVSFSLPDKGLIFIVGKSGSGKSTLMNILGGLDDASSGSVLVDGTDICKLLPNDLDNYRNEYVGIVYQHFNLFEDETVFANIKEATDISFNDITDKEIEDWLAKVDLLEKKDKLVRELSGGQKQRVAIARALAKKPHVILADEPTGNLDSKTSKNVNGYLKDISKDRLVVVISHDMPSAKKFADRIIEISDGKIVSDTTRTKVSDDQKLIQVNPDVSDDQINEVNELIKDKGVILTKTDSHFTDSNFNEKYVGEPISFSKKNKSWKRSFDLGFKFFKSTKASFIVTTLVVTIIVGLLSLAHTFSTYNGNEAVYAVCERYEPTNVVFNKGYYTSGSNSIKRNNLTIINPEDKALFQDEKRYGKAYEILPYILYNGTFNTAKFEYSSAVSDFYTTETYGVVTCDEDYLKTLFPDFKVLAGSLYGADKTADLIITDYFADAILEKNVLVRDDDYTIQSNNPKDPYANIIGVELSSKHICYFNKIAAVISTGYKEKYQTLFDIKKKVEDKELDKSVLTKIKSSDLFVKYANEIRSSFGYAYSLNPNFGKDYLSSGRHAECHFRKGQVLTDKKEIYFDTSNKHYAMYDDLIVKQGEVRLHPTLYAKLFKDTPIEDEKYITFQDFDFNQTKTEFPKIDVRLKVTGTHTFDSENCLFMLSKADFDSIAAIEYQANALSFSDPTKTSEINTVGKPRAFYTTNDGFNTVFQLVEIISLFSKVFFYIAIVLLVLVTLIVVSHNLRIIRKNQYRIGVYKSLGYSSTALSLSALFNSLAMIVGVAIVSVGFSAALSYGMNNLLLFSFITFMNQDIITSLSLVRFSLPILLLYLGIVILLTLASTLIPVLSVRKIKPNSIINKAD